MWCAYLYGRYCSVCLGYSLNKTDQKVMPSQSSCSIVSSWKRPTCWNRMCILHFPGAVFLYRTINSGLLFYMWPLIQDCLSHCSNRIHPYWFFFACFSYQFLIDIRYNGLLFVDVCFSGFSLPPSEHILRKDKKTHSEIKKHVLSHKACEGQVQASASVLSEDSMNRETDSCHPLLLTSPSSNNTRPSSSFGNVLLPDLNQIPHLSSLLPGQWCTVPGPPATIASQAAHLNQICLPCCFPIVMWLLAMPDHSKVPSQDMRLTIFKYFIYLFLERGKGGRETSICCLLHVP